MAMMLRYRTAQGAKFQTEPKGREDAEINFKAGAPYARIEIQVKGSDKPVTLDTVADCLMHFPPQSATGTLLERLTGNPKTLVLLVVSGRCNDAASRYTAPRNWNGQAHKDGSIKQKDAKALLKHIETAHPGTAKSSALEKKQSAHCKKIAKTTVVKVLTEALHRLIIIEQQDLATLERECGDILQADFRIPRDQIQAALLSLAKIVKDTKTAKKDSFPAFHSKLVELSRDPIRPLGYQTRGDEEAMIEILSKTGVLLLSGPPRVGKSDTASWVAAEFAEKGYAVIRCTDIEHAERTLQDPSPSLRLATLDDALGGAHIEANAIRILLRLDRLIRILPKNCKLIVSQSQEQLLQANKTLDLSAVKTGNHNWLNLGTTSTEFQIRVWKFAAEKYNVDVQFTEFVTKAISNQKIDLEAGCYIHLAVNYRAIGTKPTVANVLRLARQNAKQFAQALLAEGNREVASVLAISTTAKFDVDLDEFAFIRGSGGTKLPGKNTQRFSIISVGATKAPPPVGISYASKPSVTAADQTALNGLEQRKIIQIDNSRAQITHPFYRAAAEDLVYRGGTFQAQDALQWTERALHSASPLTSRAAGRNLHWIYEELSNAPSAAEKVIDIAISGLSSFFPATRDACFEFLIDLLPNLKPTFHRELPAWVDGVTYHSLSTLQWKNGEAILPKDTTGFEHVDLLINPIKFGAIKSEYQTLNSKAGGYVSTERAAKVLLYAFQKPQRLTNNIFLRLLGYDEAILRAEAARRWLSIDRKDDEQQLERLFAEDHPKVGLEALKGAISGWEDYSPDRRERVLSGLANMAQTPSVSAAMLPRLSVFGRVEYTGENTPWAIYGALMPIAMKRLPTYAHISDARLYDTAQNALRHLDVESCIAIIDGWLDWVERLVNVGNFPGEYVLGVAALLMERTTNQPEARQDRVKRLLKIPGTSCTVTILSDLVNHWDDLTEIERQQIKDLFTAKRPDTIWINAKVLIAKRVPKELEDIILNGSLCLSEGPEAILAKMDPQLLSCCVSMHVGRPGLLWNVGPHHASKTWADVITEIAKTPTNPQFELAWEDIIFLTEEERIIGVLEALGPAGANKAFKALLKGKVVTNGDFMPDVWSKLFELAPDEDTIDDWVHQISEYLPGILEHVFEVDRWIQKPEIRKKILEELFADIALINFAGRVREAADDPQLQQAVPKLIKLLEETELKPSLWGTYGDMEKLLRPVQGAEELGKRYKDLQLEKMKDSRKYKERLEKDAPLKGWVYLETFEA